MLRKYPIRGKCYQKFASNFLRMFRPYIYFSLILLLLNPLNQKSRPKRIIFLSFRCVEEKRCNRRKFQAKPLGSQENDIIEIRTVKFNLTEDAVTADASVCPNNRDVCCPGRFVEPSKPVEPIKAIETGISY